MISKTIKLYCECLEECMGIMGRWIYYTDIPGLYVTNHYIDKHRHVKVCSQCHTEKPAIYRNLRLPTKDEIENKVDIDIIREYDTDVSILSNQDTIGTYVVFNKIGEKYIGKTIKVRRRMREHSIQRFEKGDISKIHIYETQMFGIAYLEAWLIYSIIPELNEKHPDDIQLYRLRNEYLVEKVKHYLKNEPYDDAISYTADCILGRASGYRKKKIDYPHSVYTSSPAFDIEELAKLLSNRYELERQQVQNDIEYSWDNKSTDTDKKRPNFLKEIYREIEKKRQIYNEKTLKIG